MANSCGNNNNCLSKFGCPDGQLPDFVIRRHDTKPPFEVTVQDCDGSIDLTNTVLEVSMWALAKFKSDVTEDATYFALADNIGFEQSLVGDIIVVNLVRSTEQMLVTGFDEKNRLIRVQRGYNGSPASDYKRGQSIRIFRILNGIGETEMVYMDIPQVDGTTETDVLTESKLVYVWRPEDTCVPGCFWFEFKLLTMIVSSSTTMSGMFLTSTPSLTPSFTTTAPSCGLGEGVESVQRFPTEGEGFLIKITNSPTSESLT